MKKSLITLTIMLAAAAMIAAFSCPAQAAVTGPCVNCHTMHNSQDGSPMATDDDGNLTTSTYAHLTLSSCIGCHKAPTVGGAPDVMMSYTTATDNVSAGGSFAVWSSSTDDAKVHNVQNIGLTIGTDGQNTGADDVPGLKETEYDYMNNLTGGSNNPDTLTCAGATGCHGTINDNTLTTSDQGIRGFHHGSDAYRYLKIDGVAGANVIGEGAPGVLGWEADGADDTHHNVYSASTTVGINRFCANCHPDFHDLTDTQAAGSWIRHPTDNLLSATDWTLANITVDYKQNPFAWQTLDQAAPDTLYTASQTGASVACISCHRAHGTPFDDLLRFSYDTQSAGSTTMSVGCLGCHYKQKG